MALSKPVLAAVRACLEECTTWVHGTQGKDDIGYQMHRDKYGIRMRFPLARRKRTSLEIEKAIKARFGL